MIKRFRAWWESRSANEKMMWGLIVVLTIAILTRWQYVWKEIGEAFGAYFN